MKTILYAVVGGPPSDWHGLRVFGADGVQIKDVVEVNASEGWLVRFKRASNGSFFLDDQGDAARERIEGRFTIRRPADLP